MKEKYIFEREFYCIDDFGEKEKWFEYFGYTYIENKYIWVECHIEGKLSTVLSHKEGIRGWIEEYLEKLTEFMGYFKNKKEMKNYIEHYFYRELSGVEKSLDDVNVDTPCGNYWSRL